jgi:hypothetical protein
LLVVTVTVTVTLAVALAAIVVVASSGPGSRHTSVPSTATPALTSTGTTSVDSETSPVHADTLPATRPPGPGQVVSRYWREIDAHRFGAAYAYLDPEDRQGESESTFVEKHEAEGIKEARFHGASASDDGSSATVNVVSLRTNDKAKGCREWKGHYAMRSVEGHWLIHEAEIRVFRHCRG